MSFSIIRNAKVDAVVASKGGIRISVNDVFTHNFKSGSKLSRLSEQMDRDSFLALLNGGTYVFHGDHLVDFRLSDYTGFVHTDDGIKNLGEKVGFSISKPSRSAVHATPSEGLGRGINRLRSDGNGVFLGGVGEDFFLDIASLGEGGSFKNRILYRWSPFSQNIETSLEVERLICTNGMVGMSPLVSKRVPILNDWERNLEIISLNLQPTLNGILSERFESMVEQRASLSELQKVHTSLLSRVQDLSLSSSVKDLDKLQKLLALTDIQRLDGIYNQDLFKAGTKQEILKSLDSDITRYDLFNVLTEASTHTAGSVQNTRSLQTLINAVVFDSTTRSVLSNNKLSSDSDPSRVFFGS